jgi:hypothetical protein
LDEKVQGDRDGPLKQAMVILQMSSMQMSMMVDAELVVVVHGKVMDWVMKPQQRPLMMVRQVACSPYLLACV